MKLTILGSGTSHGVPSIECMLQDYAHCPQGVCLESETDPKHRRTRASILVEVGGCAILVDTSQDFREQVIRNRVKRIDAVLYTHAHADHIYGLPDLRSYTHIGHEPRPLTLYGPQDALCTIRQYFDYAFDPSVPEGGGLPKLHLRPQEGPFSVSGVEIVPVPVEHGHRPCFGYRIGEMGYVPDLKNLPRESKELLKGLDLLILNALRRAPEHVSHLTLEESVALARELKPRRCYFTHLTHDIHYRIDGEKLPPNMAFAHDGLRLTI